MLFIEADDRWERVSQPNLPQQMDVVHSEDKAGVSLRICQSADGTVYKREYSRKYGLLWYKYCIQPYHKKIDN